MKKLLALSILVLFVFGAVFADEEVILPVVGGEPLVVLPFTSINADNKNRYQVVSFNENNIESVNALGEVSAKPVSQNYKIAISADIGDGIVVKEIKTETAVVYINEDDYGRALLKSETKNISISFIKKDDNNFELIMTKIPKGVYRINMKVVINIDNNDYLVTFQLNNQKLIPTKGAKEISPVVEESKVIMPAVITVNTDVKTDTKPEVKSEVKPEVKPDEKPEVITPASISSESYLK